MKKLYCRDLGFDCPAEIVAESDAEILSQAAEHAKVVHGLQEVSPEVVEAVKANTQEV